VLTSRLRAQIKPKTYSWQISVMNYAPKQDEMAANTNTQPSAAFVRMTDSRQWPIFDINKPSVVGLRFFKSKLSGNNQGIIQSRIIQDRKLTPYQLAGDCHQA